MKKTILIIASAVIIIFGGGFTGLHFYIGSTIKDYIEIAQSRYPGDAEEALIAYMLDENNSMENRTHTAIWTLGQIRSEKALPMLKSIYTGDKKGNSCHGKHDSMLCQYEIYKAIQSIEKGGFTHARLK